MKNIRFNNLSRKLKNLRKKRHKELTKYLMQNLKSSGNTFVDLDIVHIHVPIMKIIELCNETNISEMYPKTQPYPEELLHCSLMRSLPMTVEQIASTITDLTPRPPVCPKPT